MTQGFTLLEILIALSLAAIVGVVATQTLVSFTQNSTKENQKTSARDELKELSHQIVKNFRERLTPRGPASPTEPNPPVLLPDRATGGPCKDLMIAQRRSDAAGNPGVEWIGFHTVSNAECLECVQLRKHGLVITDLARYPKTSQLTKMSVCFSDQTLAVPPQVTFEISATAKVGSEVMDMKELVVLPMGDASKGIEFLPPE